jgi:hypothetical protein
VTFQLSDDGCGFRLLKRDGGNGGRVNDPHRHYVHRRGRHG